MVLTKEELIASLQNEVRILLHLAGKVDKSRVDYRPAPKQRSILELLQYMAIMGPTQVAIIKAGAFDRAAMIDAWGPAEAGSKTMSFDQAVSAIQKQSDEYARVLSGWTEADFRGEVEMFGRKNTRGSLLVNLVLSGYAAYRTQLFCYLKASGRDELNTMNLWAGVDGSMTAA
ncbi:MAG: hypothetical protein DMG57_11860 [Acidobacteria bacterium]|nr:MAG: hypothetical protein DMG57_11860 [Acidobacteriota bacterium]